jgi:hypothetical protein
MLQKIIIEMDSQRKKGRHNEKLWRCRSRIEVTMRKTSICVSFHIFPPTQISNTEAEILPQESCSDIEKRVWANK